MITTAKTIVDGWDEGQYQANKVLLEKLLDYVLAAAGMGLDPEEIEDDVLLMARGPFGDATLEYEGNVAYLFLAPIEDFPEGYRTGLFEYLAAR